MARTSNLLIKRFIFTKTFMATASETHLLWIDVERRKSETFLAYNRCDNGLTTGIDKKQRFANTKYSANYRFVYMIILVALSFLQLSKISHNISQQNFVKEDRPVPSLILDDNNHSLINGSSKNLDPFI